MHPFIRSAWTRLTAAWGVLFGADEVTLMLGLVLLVVSLWPAFQQLALLPAALVLIWMALPSRAAFVSKVPESEPRRKG